MITVCIPTIPSRRSLLTRLLWSIGTQNVNIVIADGDGPLGDKLDACFQAAITSHVVAVDDDDLLAPDFCQCDGDADFLGYRILWLENGRYAGSVKHSGTGDTTWCNLDRGVSPKCPVRTDIARAHPFGNHYTADREWSRDVQGAITTHTFTDRHLYTYDHWAAHQVATDATDLATPQRDVGVWPVDWNRVTWL